MDSYGVSQVATRNPDGSGFTPLGTLGHVAGLTYADTLPGGPDSLTCTLQVPTSFRNPAFNPGRITEVYRGGSLVWDGKLGEPVPGPGGWQITATGAGNYGDNYLAIYSAWNQNDALDQAITRGLRWVKPSLASTGLYLSEPQDSGSVTVTDFLNLLTKAGAYTWHIGRRRTLSVFPIPTTVTRVLVSNSPVARSLAAYVNALYGRYQATADNASTGAPGTFALASATNAISIARHQRQEAFWDMSAAGVISSGTAAANVATALTTYQGASWAGPITVSYGQYLNISGTPVDLGCEMAGEVCLLLLADGPYGGEVSPSPPVTFPVGRAEYSDEARTLAITPYQAVAADLSTLLTSLATAATLSVPPMATS